MDTLMIVNYMESLRYQTKLSQEDFLHDVTSKRQYQRYLSGQCPMPLSTAFVLSERLGLSFEKMIFNYIQSIDLEERLVKSYFNSVASKDLLKAESIEKELKDHNFLDLNKKAIYKAAMLLKEYQQKKIYLSDFISQLNDMVDISSIESSGKISDYESIIIGLLIEYSRQQQSRLLNLFLSVQKNTIVLMSGYNIYTTLQIWFWIIKTLGRMERYHELVVWATKIIESQKSTYNFYLLEHFYYYLSLAYMYLGMEEELGRTLVKLNALIDFFEGEKKSRFKEKISKNIKYNHYATD